jgi:EAL domain-containing protein (putative c-di-GMP-specific phosphodiesterase class I)
MLMSACRQLRAWREGTSASLRMALTLPPGVIERGDLPRLVGDALAQSGVEPSALMLSMPQIAPRDPGRAASAIDALLAQGVCIVLDELGGGMRPLAELRRLRGGVVRFSSTFLRALAADADQGAVVRPLFALVHSLNLAVLVTGVDTSAQAAFLREVGCDYAQGAHFGKAMAAADVQALLGAERRALAAS